MKIIRNLKKYLIVILGILFCAILILNEYLVYGIFILIIFIIINLLRTNIFSRLKQSEIINENLRKELVEVKSNKLNVLGIKEILDIGLLEVNTKLTRVWNQNIEQDNRTLNFIGALDVNLQAKFGLDLSKVKIREDDEKISISNTKPHIISFNDLEYTWKISELLELKKPLLGSSHWRKSNDLVEHCNEIKDNYQKEVHIQIKKGPEELNWIINPLHEKIQKILSHKYKNIDKEIIFVSDSDDSFSII